MVPPRYQELIGSEGGRRLRFQFSIFTKLLLVIIPLVCIPVALVGYFSVQASVESVNRLVHQEQMVQVEAAAQKINDILHTSRRDLMTISRLPVLEDYHLARSFRLQAEAEFNRSNLIGIASDFLSRSKNYSRIRFLDAKGRELIKVSRKGQENDLLDCSGSSYFKKALSLKPGESFLSNITSYPHHRGGVIHCVAPFFSGWKEFAGVVVVDLDFRRVTKIVRGIKLGERGYSFLLDETGLTLEHPSIAPYAVNLLDHPEPSLRELSGNMLLGGAGWFPYTYDGQEKVAAYAPVPDMGWSLAVTIPTEELSREARAIQKRVLQVAGLTLAATLLCVSILSYSLVRPVRRLVEASNRVAHGDLGQELSVKGGGELAELTRSFNRMTRNLSRIQDELVRSEKLISLGRLSAGVAHEIRNPLNAMKGAMAHLNQRWGHEPLFRQYNSLVTEEIDRLNRVVSDFLYFAKQAPPRLGRVDLNNLLLATQRLLSGASDDKGVRFNNDLEETLPLVAADQHQIEQVLINLLINAMDAMKRGGEINAETHSENGFVELTIVDHGSGISEKNMRSIFDPFFTTKEDGTGLGLPLSLGIVEAHGGALRIKSRSTSGTRVLVRLPVAGPEEV